MDERKIEILNTIIKSYIKSAVPVGSRTISKESGLGISSATIRNEMADLEDLGYLNKPHTSAGRVPSTKAYRFYVDEILQIFNGNNFLNNRLKDRILSDATGIEDIYKNTVKELANYTNCVSFIITPKKRDTKINHIELLKLDETLVLILLIGNRGVVEKDIISLKFPIKNSELNMIKAYLNSELTQIEFNEIEEMKVTVTGELLKHKDFIYDVIKRASTFNSHIKSVDIYYDGLGNVLNFLDFKDITGAKNFMTLLENRSLFIEALSSMEDSNIDVSIGDENDSDLLKDMSIVRAGLNVPSKYGQIGILGPMRMDYQNLLDSVALFRNILSDIIMRVL